MNSSKKFNRKNSNNSVSFLQGLIVECKKTQHKVNLIASRIPTMVSECESVVEKMFTSEESDTPEVNTLAFRQHINHFAEEGDFGYVLDVADFLNNASKKEVRKLLEGLVAVKKTADNSMKKENRMLLFSERTQAWVQTLMSKIGDDLSDLPDGF